MKKRVLVVDDLLQNRLILEDILSSDYEVLLASGGKEAIDIIDKNHKTLSLVLLDMVMDDCNGLDVLKNIKAKNYLERLPIMMISSDSDQEIIQQAFNLGVVDFISRSIPGLVILNRVKNTIALYEKQQNLYDLVKDQIKEKEKSNQIMLNIFSEIVETRNGESGAHCLHISAITEVLIRKLLNKTDKYKIDELLITDICCASSLHDIGKILIPDNILNKPGRLTNEEFAIIKTHTTEGAKMLDNLSSYKSERLVNLAHDIALYHHERYDGRGYPEQLIGDAIPIWSQIVSIADVIDALTSERCYKKAFSFDEAYRMILNNECGVFNPLLIECMVESKEQIAAALKVGTKQISSNDTIDIIVQDLMENKKQDKDN